ncbi:MAG: acyl-CoA dehydrogenase family protein [Gemmatimonadota bacterium]|jgi:butyryl-CoA dehydrogenase
MEPYFTDEHRAFQEEIRAFAETEIKPLAGPLDENEEFPWDNVQIMAQKGWMGIPIPEEYGGMGKDYMSYTLAVEELARVDASHSITVSAHTTLGTSPIFYFGTEEQKKKWIPYLAQGRVLGGFGLTEPGAGSDASGTRTRAVRADGGWRINGSKIFITHAGVGEIFVVTAVTDPERRAKGITNFIVCKPTVDLDRAQALGVGHASELPYTNGVRAGNKEAKLGWRSSDTRELFLDDSWVPEEHQLGEEGRGFINFMKTLDAGRVGVAALSLGLAEGAFEEALKYTQEREQFGRKIWDFQTVQFRLADLATEIQAGKHLTYHAAWLQDQGRPYGKEAAMAKLYCSELCMRATTQAVQILGGVGYTQDYPVERMMRDAKVCEIGEGTSEIQKIVIGRHLVREVFGA